MVTNQGYLLCPLLALPSLKLVGRTVLVYPLV
jgi:hypothetical protein